MNKKLLVMALSSFIIAGSYIHTCPITLYNDINVPVYVVTASVADKLTDIATAADIKNKISSLNLPIQEYKKIRSGATETVGTDHTRTYYVYVKANNASDSEDKDYIRLYQLQLTSCIHHQEKAQWWKTNTIKLSQLKANSLTPSQKQYLSLQSIAQIPGYSTSAAYKKLHRNLLGLWKVVTTKETPAERYYYNSTENTQGAPSLRTLKKTTQKEPIILDDIADSVL